MKFLHFMTFQVSHDPYELLHYGSLNSVSALTNEIFLLTFRTQEAYIRHRSLNAFSCLDCIHTWPSVQKLAEDKRTRRFKHSVVLFYLGKSRFDVFFWVSVANNDALELYRMYDRIVMLRNDTLYKFYTVSTFLLINVKDIIWKKENSNTRMHRKHFRATGENRTLILKSSNRTLPSVVQFGRSNH